MHFYGRHGLELWIFGTVEVLRMFSLKRCKFLAPRVVLCIHKVSLTGLLLAVFVGAVVVALEPNIVQVSQRRIAVGSRLSKQLFDRLAALNKVGVSYMHLLLAKGTTT